MYALDVDRVHAIDGLLDRRHSFSSPWRFQGPLVQVPSRTYIVTYLIALLNFQGWLVQYFIYVPEREMALLLRRRSIPVLPESFAPS